MDPTCVACDSDDVRGEHSVPETMFRTGDVFSYLECARCRTLRIREVPADLARHYGSDEYYSFRNADEERVRRLARYRRVNRLNSELLVRAGVGKGYPWLRHAGILPRDRVLDLGCGAGVILLWMHMAGYAHLSGADPFLPEDRELAPDVHLRSSGHADVRGEFDWIMMHHSFEHVPDPGATLTSVARLLAPDGRLLIRMPVAGTAAWRRYGVSWVQLDAPRHLAVYTVPAVHLLAESYGFVVERIFFDSTAFQFWGSELARSGEPVATGPGRFADLDLRLWEEEARRRNQGCDGDQAGIVLRRRPPDSSEENR